MSLTISASTGDDKVCSATKFASLSSPALTCVATRSTPSSGHFVIPGLYSASQIGQNIVLRSQAIWYERSDFTDAPGNCSSRRQTLSGVMASKHAGLNALFVNEQSVS